MTQRINQPEKKVDTPNPLASFFRKSKLSLKLPSKGNWYKEGELTLDKNGGLPIFSMNSGDDIRFRAGDATLSGKSTYDLLRSCAPGILNPENIPNIDIDAILLAIRLASYGDNFEFTASVPNTKLTKKINMSLLTLLKEIDSRKEQWDDEISIEDDSNQILTVNIHPIPLNALFSTSKNIQQQKKILTKNFDADENLRDEKVFIDGVNQLTNTAIDLICSSIQHITLIDSNKTILLELDATSPQDKIQLNQILKTMDVEYFNAIRDHLELQRKKYTFKTPAQLSTSKEIEAGAPKEWDVELTFMGSSFLPEQNTFNETII